MECVEALVDHAAKKISGKFGASGASEMAQLLTRHTGRVLPSSTSMPEDLTPSTSARGHPSKHSHIVAARMSQSREAELPTSATQRAAYVMNLVDHVLKAINQADCSIHPLIFDPIRAHRRKFSLQASSRHS